MEFITQPYMIAFWFGGLTAISLPIGAMLGIWAKPPTRVVAAIMAFGAGNLLSALTLELIEPAFRRTGFWPISIGCVLGCLVFVSLNAVLENNGGYMRKVSTLVAHLKAQKRKRMREMVERLGNVDILRMLPPEEVHHIIPSMEDRKFEAGTVIFRQGDFGASLYIIEDGKVRVSATDDEKGKEVKVAELGKGETFGEMALLWDKHRTATVEALTDVSVWEIHREDFDDIIESSPLMRKRIEELAEQRKAGLPESARMNIGKWKETVVKSLEEEDVRPSSVEMDRALEEGKAGGGAALSMWLGIFLDGIPESLVIGASIIAAPASPALIGGLFFANLPEAMSSGTIMKRQGNSTGKIFWMWMSLAVVTGLGALVGNITFVGVSHMTLAVVEGLAAGAMLAMIAQTMLPEAYEQGGWLVGILTVLGFLSALMFRALGTAMSSPPAEHHARMLLNAVGLC